jgi:tmRNA-binding protein
VAQNRRARHDYDILDTYEAGIVLAGSEVKSLREGKAQMRDSFARVQDGEVWLHGVHVPPYTYASGFGYTDPDRRRKLLMHRRQIDELDWPSTSRRGGPRSAWPWPGAARAMTNGTPSRRATPTWRRVALPRRDVVP